MTTVATLFAVTISATAIATCESSPTQPSPAGKAADVRVGNSHLVATCFNGAPIDGNNVRDWKLSVPTAFVFTMKNQPRSGIENHAPGLAAISFTPQAGHTYEIEVRADAATFSKRVWPKGEWKPVVRDRTTDQIVSGEPQWVDGCK